MCFGGGGNDEARRAREAEERRQHAIDETSAKINAIFNDPARSAGRQQVADAVKKRGTMDLNRAFDKQGRKLKFAMARQGLTSGSADVDLHDTLNDDYARAFMKVLGRANEAGNSLLAADESARQRLLAQAATGAGLTNLTQNAIRSTQSNLANARASIGPQTFSNAFDQLADVYKQSQVLAGQRQAERAGLGVLFNMNNRFPGY